jgi:hypothetical protein
MIEPRNGRIWPCGAFGPAIATGPKAKKRPARCNRPEGHDGEHVEHAPRTFAVLARWMGAVGDDCAPVVPIDRGRR